MPQDDVLTSFIARSRLKPQEILDLLKEAVHKREIQQFNQTFGEIHSDKLAHFADCLDKALNPKMEEKTEKKKKKGKKK